VSKCAFIPGGRASNDCFTNNSSEPRFSTKVKVGGLVTTVSALVALLFLLFPSLRPGYSPPTKAGSITSIVMAYGTSTAATVSQEIQGFNNEKCSLWYSVLYRQTRQPVSSPNEVYFLTPESQTIVLTRHSVSLRRRSRGRTYFT